jgi:hypothetical protein
VPLVFVHGVNVRLGPPHYENVKMREAYFRRFLLRRRDGTGGVFSPYWGAYGVRFRWNLASLAGAPADELFGDAAEPFASLRAAFAPNAVAGRTLVEVARSSFAAAVDLAWAAAAYAPTNEISADEMAAAAERAAAYVERCPAPGWVGEVSSDDEFLQRLAREIAEDDAPESFGSAALVPVLRRAVNAVAAVVRGPGALVARGARAGFGTELAFFAGDVIEYVDNRGVRGRAGPIVSVIVNDLRDADAARTDDDPELVVVAHSMGGNIAYDILTHFADDLHCDTLITVGSQIALFEEMATFRASDRSIPDARRARASKPPNVLRWINVFDPLDVLAFRAGAVFEGVEDLELGSSFSPLHAHGHYFYYPGFYRQIAGRLASTPR